MTKTAIKKGEELFCDYGYHGQTQISWFREEYKRFEKLHPQSRYTSFGQEFWQFEELLEKGLVKSKDPTPDVMGGNADADDQDEEPKKDVASNGGKNDNGSTIASHN